MTIVLAVVVAVIAAAAVTIVWRQEASHRRSRPPATRRAWCRKHVIRQGRVVDATDYRALAPRRCDYRHHRAAPRW